MWRREWRIILRVYLQALMHLLDHAATIHSGALMTMKEMRPSADGAIVSDRQVRFTELPL
jgi:hypothetical protein